MHVDPPSLIFRAVRPRIRGDSSVSVVQSFHGKSAIQRDGKEVARWTATPASIKSVIKLLTAIVHSEQHHSTNVFDKHQVLATFSDCALYYSDGAVYRTPQTPELRARHAYDFTYEPGLKPEWLLRVMREDWFGCLPEGERDARIQCLREFMGHVFLGSLPAIGIHKQLMCVGFGNDGKSVLQEIVLKCLPPNSCSHITMEMLMSGQGNGESNRAALEGKIANLVDDSGFDPIKENPAWKSAVSFKTISCRRLKHEPHPFVPRAAWWLNFNCNKAGGLPELVGKTGGMLRRFLCIEFPRSLEEGSQDGHITDKLLNLESREIVCWAIDAALGMLNNRRTQFTTPACHSKITDKWITHTHGNDPVDIFLEECTRPSKKPVSLDALYDAFAAWHVSYYDTKSGRKKPAFSRSLRKAGIKLGSRTMINGVRMQPCYVSVISDDADAYMPEPAKTFVDPPVVITDRELPSALRFGPDDKEPKRSYPEPRSVPDAEEDHQPWENDEGEAAF